MVPYRLCGDIALSVHMIEELYAYPSKQHNYDVVKPVHGICFKISSLQD